MGRLGAQEVALVSGSSSQAVAVLDALTCGHLFVRHGTCRHQPQLPRTQKILSQAALLLVYLLYLPAAPGVIPSTICPGLQDSSWELPWPLAE